MSIKEAASDKISMLDAYDSMVEFIEAYFYRGMGESEDLAALLSSITRLKENDGYPPDGALWNDFFEIAYSKSSVVSDR